MRDDLEFVGREFLAAAEILEGAAAAQRDGAQGDKAKRDQTRASHRSSFGVRFCPLIMAASGRALFFADE
jgi:hypothetical protein